MIVSSLYPDNTGVYMGDTSNQYQAQITGNFSQTYSGETIDNADAYFLGYISKDKLPPALQMSVMYFDDGDLIAKNITDNANFACGYCYITEKSETARNLYTNENGVKTFGQYATSARLINQNYPMFSGRSSRSTPAFTISGYYIVYSPEGTRIYPTGENNNTPTWGISIQYVQDVLKFFNDETDYTINIFSGQYNVTINADIIKTGNAYIKCDTADAYVRLIVTNFSTNNGGYCKNGSSYNIFRPAFMAKSTAHYNDSTYESLSFGVSYAGAFIVNGYRLLSDNPTEENPYFAYIGVHGTITAEQLADAQSSVGNWLSWSEDGNLGVIRELASGAGRYAFPVRILSMDEIKRAYYLMYRGDTTYNGMTTGYVRNVTYATDVTPQNEFLGKWKTGNLSDTTFKNSLRPWQYEDFQANEFTDDDIPPYTPEPEPSPRPEPVAPGDDEHGGDDITLPSIDGLGGSFGFTTQYALRGTQLEELGSLLWTGFDSTNPNIDAYLQNFVYRVDLNTGSVNMSDIMEFFVSLRAYPLPLGNLISVTAAGNAFYIGSGAQPLTFTSILHTANTYLSEIDAGSVTIPFWFGDYRDYSTEITLYLPYCGTAELNAADVMGGTLSATYVVDLSTGSCTAYVMCDTYDAHTYPVAILPGQLGVDIPITASNAGRVGARLLGDRINVAENLMSVAKYGATGIGALMSGNVAGAIRSGISAFIDPAIQDQKLLAGMAERGAIAAPMLSGGRGLAGFKNPMTAYVQVRSPFYAVPDNFADAVGDPAAAYVQIGSCSGFCRFINVDVSGIATDAEDQAEIRRALENGVII